MLSLPTIKCIAFNYQESININKSSVHYHAREEHEWPPVLGYQVSQYCHTLLLRWTPWTQAHVQAAQLTVPANVLLAFPGKGH